MHILSIICMLYSLIIENGPRSKRRKVAKPIEENDLDSSVLYRSFNTNKPPLYKFTNKVHCIC